MKKYRKIKNILPIAAIFIPSLLFAPKTIAGGFGAEIFCTMRDGGNEHESSWEAAYTYIKKQKGGFFKVSPKQAAAQIIETVVREREKFSYCVEYLDNLNPNRKLERDLKKESERMPTRVPGCTRCVPDRSLAVTATVMETETET